MLKIHTTSVCNCKVTLSTYSMGDLWSQTVASIVKILYFLFFTLSPPPLLGIPAFGIKKACKISPFSLKAVCIAIIGKVEAVLHSF